MVIPGEETLMNSLAFLIIAKPTALTKKEQII